MAETTVSTDVNAGPDEVWALVGDFGGVGDYLPGIDSVRLEGDDRVIGMFGMEIRERLVELDEAGRSITYSIVDGVPVESHRATVTVKGDGAGRSTVTWTVAATPDEMLPLFSDTYAKALEAIAARFA
jgi:carbon monoxide dehydrogenase subunit G